MAAGSAILQVYQSGCFDVENKADNSPLTRADRASHEIIEANLIASGHPILSEEGKGEISLIMSAKIGEDSGSLIP